MSATVNERVSDVPAGVVGRPRDRSTWLVSGVGAPIVVRLVGAAGMLLIGPWIQMRGDSPDDTAELHRRHDVASAASALPRHHRPRGIAGGRAALAGGVALPTATVLQREPRESRARRRRPAWDGEQA